MSKFSSWKKAGTAIVATLMTVGMLGACGSSSSSSGTKITIFNSKVEIESQMEDMAAKYSKEKGIDVEVYYSNDTVAAHLATKYASKDPYTISMVDAKDIYTPSICPTRIGSKTLTTPSASTARPTASRFPSKPVA